MKYIKIAQKSDLAAEKKMRITIEDRRILLTNFEGTYYAIGDKCPHMGGSLYEGTLDGFSVTCPRHGSVFDIRTGKLIHAGKLLFLKVKVNDTRSYPLKIEGNDILIDIE